MGLKEYVIRRILLMIPVLLGVALLIFSITQMIPPFHRALLYITNPEKLTKEGREEVIVKYGLNESAIAQFGHWFNNILHRNFGMSYIAKKPVLDVIMSKWPATIEIVMFAAPLIIIIGTYLGILSAMYRDLIVDHIIRIFSLIGWSLPTFWFGLILIAVFTGWLQLLPRSIYGRVSSETFFNVINSPQFVQYTGIYSVDGILNGRLDVTAEVLCNLVLPVTTLVVVSVAGLARVMRSSMLEALTKGYVITAKAKGLKFREVINKHVRRNALIPVVTLSGLYVAGMLNGLVITETIFRIGGLGMWAWESTYNMDIAAVVAFALFTGILFVVSNLIVDILYAYIDPRIRLG